MRTSFGLVPGWVVTRVTDPAALRLYVHLAWKYADEARHAFPDETRLADELGVGSRSIGRAVRRLKEADALVVIRHRQPDGYYGRNLYTLPMDDPREADHRPSVADGADQGKQGVSAGRNHRPPVADPGPATGGRSKEQPDLEVQPDLTNQTRTHTSAADAACARNDRADQLDDDPPWLFPLEDQDLDEQDHRNGQGHASATGGVVGCEEPSADDLARVTTGTSADEAWRQLWKDWPRKVAKKPAQQAWLKAIKTTDPEVILTGARRYAEAHRGGDLRYVLHLRTWLTAERWTDEPEPPRNGHRNGHQTFRSPGVDAYVGEL